MPNKQDATPSSRERLLIAAQELFAEHGVNGVGLRDIAKAAGHKNVNSIRYHFGNKENLIKSIITWGGQQGEQWRRESLDRLEERDNHPGTREIIGIILESVLHESSPEYIRFIAQVTLSHRELIWKTYEQAVGDSMARCYAHFRRSITHVPATVLEQRFAFTEIYVQHVISAWTYQKKRRRTHSHWSAPFFHGNLFDTLEAMLTAPCRAACSKAQTPSKSINRRRSKARATST
ncbi:MAG: TetR/AcrR family transcriptional regulator [Pseudomonadales bacterium]